MPTYTYSFECPCQTQVPSPEVERYVPIAERDEQNCECCGRSLKRKITFTGLTWAPTAGGMR